MPLALVWLHSGHLDPFRKRAVERKQTVEKETRDAKGRQILPTHQHTSTGK